jgi:small-conductance mechanosensitive channel
MRFYPAWLVFFACSIHGAEPAPLSRASVLTAPQVIQILDDTVEWYRTLGTQQQNASQPSDLLILFANRQTADKVVGLSFQIARANAELLSSEANAAQAAADASLPWALTQQQAQLDAQRQSIQREMAADRSTRGGAAKVSELQSELAVVDARKNLLNNLADFDRQSDSKGSGTSALKAQIDAIAASVPTTSATPATPTAATTPPSAANDKSNAAPGRSGIWDLGTDVMKLRNKINTIDLIDRHTAGLAATFQKIDAAPQSQLQAYSARGEVLAAQADHATGTALQDLRAQFDTLAWLIQQTSAIVIPLSEEQVLLLQYRHNLSSWKDATRRQYQEAVAALGVRLGILAGVLAILFAFAEVWRRAVVRYAHETRRRYQLLLVRRIVLWTLVIVIVGLNFVTEISTFATFAGLLTAGVAVAMQSVLVSVVGYFFLIGKYGIRVGDRIQIGTVVGDVIDIGLVRMHLLELNQNGPLGPTGRVVAFANLIVFQPSGGLFKQIPGVNLSWHETILALPTVSDYAALKNKLLAAVNDVVGEYREELLRQTKEIERSTETSSTDDSVPQVQMHLSEGHMQALIRYPVHLKHEAEIDERISEAILKVLSESTEDKTRTP